MADNFTPKKLYGRLVKDAPVLEKMVGVGHADKDQVHAMVKILLPHSNAKGPDAADALAIAITHAHMSESSDRMASLMARAR